VTHFLQILAAAGISATLGGTAQRQLHAVGRGCAAAARGSARLRGAGERRLAAGSLAAWHRQQEGQRPSACAMEVADQDMAMDVVDGCF
jgi:hypothetical protein